MGSSTTEYDFGGSANFEQFRNAQFPIEANLNVEIVTTGKTQKLKVTGFQFVKKG
ncbi:phage associated protein [Neisseria gonorrhoeae]|uniref:Phage associated protein n=1 Tax=Neisseria gonorrhoeae TaxID=485 RepID=A0A378VVB6_NEIGO|nr:phage associated protein [Neisseria gonorrhoeae]SUB32420.1 phage associated protein [Neisseria gonorrhoeae]